MGRSLQNKLNRSSIAVDDSARSSCSESTLAWLSLLPEVNADTKIQAALVAGNERATTNCNESEIERLVDATIADNTFFSTERTRVRRAVITALLAQLENAAEIIHTTNNAVMQLDKENKIMFAYTLTNAQRHDEWHIPANSGTAISTLVVEFIAKLKAHAETAHALREAELELACLEACAAAGERSCEGALADSCQQLIQHTSVVGKAVDFEVRGASLCMQRACSRAIDSLTADGNLNRRCDKNEALHACEYALEGHSEHRSSKAFIAQIQNAVNMAWKSCTNNQGRHGQDPALRPEGASVNTRKELRDRITTLANQVKLALLDPPPYAFAHEFLPVLQPTNQAQGAPPESFKVHEKWPTPEPTRSKRKIWVDIVKTISRPLGAIDRSMVSVPVVFDHTMELRRIPAVVILMELIILCNPGDGHEEIPAATVSDLLFDQTIRSSYKQNLAGLLLQVSLGTAVVGNVVGNVVGRAFSSREAGAAANNLARAAVDLEKMGHIHEVKQFSVGFINAILLNGTCTDALREQVTAGIISGLPAPPIVVARTYQLGPRQTRVTTGDRVAASVGAAGKLWTQVKKGDTPLIEIVAGFAATVQAARTGEQTIVTDDIVTQLREAPGMIADALKTSAINHAKNAGGEVVDAARGVIGDRMNDVGHGARRFAQQALHAATGKNTVNYPENSSTIFSTEEVKKLIDKLESRFTELVPSGLNELQPKCSRTQQASANSIDNMKGYISTALQSMLRRVPETHIPAPAHLDVLLDAFRRLQKGRQECSDIACVATKLAEVDTSSVEVATKRKVQALAMLGVVMVTLDAAAACNYTKKKLQDIATTGLKKIKQTGVLDTALPGDNMNPLHTLGSAIFIATAASAAAGYGKMRGSGGSDETSGQPQRSGTPPDQRATSSPNPRERWGTRQTPAWWRQHDPTSWERTSTPRHWHGANASWDWYGANPSWHGQRAATSWDWHGANPSWHWHRTAAGRETTFTPVHWRAAAERRGGTSTPGSWRTDS